MNREDIIGMAREAGFVNLADAYWDCTTEGIESLFQAAYDAGAAAENEACAKVCEESTDHWVNRDCAAAIRARGQA